MNIFKSVNEIIAEFKLKMTDVQCSDNRSVNN